jgi:fatty acid desaturase
MQNENTLSLFKYSSKDILLVLIAFIQVILLIFPFWIKLSFASLFSLVIFQVYLVGLNYQCIAHNFIHNPFFNNSYFNSIFSVWNTLCLGVPQSLYRIHHLNHHRYNNHPEKDDSSTYRHGKNGNEENIFLYSLLGVLRTDLISLYKSASKKSPLVHFEFASLLIFIFFLVSKSWILFLSYVLSIYLLGQIFALWENYCEHHLADFNDRKRDSVSCYNSVYNLLWFNNGFHQEHHFSPQVHWTQMASVKDKLPSDRVITKYCHLFHSFKKPR